MSEVEKGFSMRPVYWLLLIIVVIFIFAVFLSREIVVFWLNLSEFGELFIRPIYFGLLGGLVLATIAFFRVDFRNRRSIVWWSVRLIVRLMRSGRIMEGVSPTWLDFDSFKLSPLRFFVWQFTKVFVGAAFFTNTMFGMAVDAAILGWKPGIEAVPRIFGLPFTTPPLEMAYAEANIVPLVPFLTLLTTPLLRFLWVRLILLVAVTQAIRIIMPFVAAYVWGLEMPSPVRFLPKIQALAAVFLLWFMFSMFFTSFIDYNTRYPILGLGAAGIVLVVFACLDRTKKEKDRAVSLISPQRRHLSICLGALAIIGLAAVSMMLFNNSVADVRKLEMLGPYSTQLISVNRFLAELDKVQEVPYEFGLSSIPANQIDGYVAQRKELLEKVRLWDHEGSFDKLRPEIGLIPYVDFAEADILRFNGSLYWSASMDLILPAAVRPEDRWYATRFVYTHVPDGFLTLDAHKGRIVDSAKFFPQRRIYYGEGGLFHETWVAFPVGRTVSDEVGGHFYDGRGGIDISPPLSWAFEPNFLLSYPTTTMRVLRYRDVYDRMRLLFPYFVYGIGDAYVDMWPVTDGEATYWCMPLIIFLNCGNVPWSGGSYLARLVGYALIDVYHGDIRLIVTGDDFFSELFKRVYSDHISTEVPEWLKPQLRYPEELFEWRIFMYNFYHVTDPATYIAAKEFFTVPGGLDTYYIKAQPPGFEDLEFVGLLSLELRGALGENLAGYMVVRNDYPHTGDMVFYKVPLGAETKLLGPTAINEALERNPEFAKLKTLLRNPRVGNQIFYRIGNYDVFFIPVYTAPGGGVVTQIGTIATVGADFAGEYYVSLGSTVEESFRGFLAEIAGVEAPPPQPEISEEERIAKLVSAFEAAGLSVLRPTSVSPDVSFLEGSVRYVSDDDWINVQPLLESFLESCRKFQVSRVFMWIEDGKVNFGIMAYVEDIVELHYIRVELI